jgi:hypothetical protein
MARSVFLEINRMLVITILRSVTVACNERADGKSSLLREVFAHRREVGASVKISSTFEKVTNTPRVLIMKTVSRGALENIKTWMHNRRMETALSRTSRHMFLPYSKLLQCFIAFRRTRGPIAVA